MIIYNKEKTRARIINDVTYMLNPKSGHELRVNNEIFQRYNNKDEVINITKQIIDAMINGEDSFEI